MTSSSSPWPIRPCRAVRSSTAGSRHCADQGPHSATRPGGGRAPPAIALLAHPEPTGGPQRRQRSHARRGRAKHFPWCAPTPRSARCICSVADPTSAAEAISREFGTSADPATADLIRTLTQRGPAARHGGDRVVAHLHGACVGAGIELPALAGRVMADPGTRMRLPEVAMGLIPGAGGTATLPRRIGRHRTAWMALSGQFIGATTGTGLGTHRRDRRDVNGVGTRPRRGAVAAWHRRSRVSEKPILSAVSRGVDVSRCRQGGMPCQRSTRPRSSIQRGSWMEP